MTNQLKQIMLKMVRLSATDQRWILRQLPDEQLARLKNHQGLDLLDSAQRFRKLNVTNLALPATIPKPLPLYCAQLAMKAPLYIAIILEQGDYPWQSLFLQQFDSEKRIAAMLENRVPDIKLSVRQALYEHWGSNIEDPALIPDSWIPWTSCETLLKDGIIQQVENTTENDGSFEAHLENAHG